MDDAFEMLLATMDALTAEREFSVWSPLVAGWMQWTKYAKEMI